MIELPRRSVTRFFVPMIDVLTLLFCIFLLMPMSGLVLPAEESALEGEGPDGRGLSAAERRELLKLRRERQQWRDIEALQRERKDLEQLLRQLRLDPQEVLQQQFVMRVLQIQNDGKLVYYDLRRPKERHIEVTRDNVQAFLAEQKRAAGGKGVYYLILYPRPEEGLPAFPLRRQREAFDEWFQDVPHSYDIPFQGS